MDPYTYNNYIINIYSISYKDMFKAILLLTCLIILSSSKSAYKVVGTYKNSTTVVLNLTYTGSDDFYIKPTSPIVKHLQFTFHTLGFNDFTFKIIDINNKRYQVPQVNIFPIDPLASFSFPIANAAISFEYSQMPFDFRITRKQNKAVLFSTYQKNIIFSDYYIEIGTEIDSQYLFGLGQRFSQSFLVKNGKWTIFNRDAEFDIDRGDGHNTYGFYPFYLQRQRQNLFHVNYFRSSNAMDIIKEEYLGQHYLTFKVIGGIIDFRFFLGENNPETTVQKINFYSGRSMIPPFWSFGFHQCRWGYQNSSDLLEVLSRYESNKIPLDTIWTDIDYMLDLQDFTIDEQRFSLSDMRKIREKYRWVPIIDAGIKTSGYAYEQGLKRNVYLKDYFGKEDYKGQVWPGETTFVDFFHPGSTKYWTDMLQLLYSKINFDGVWLDMNQLSNFCDGPCQRPKQKIFDYSNDLPYSPGSDVIQKDTISLNCTHYGNISEANLHPFYSFLQTYSTYLFLKTKTIKPFILTRSSTLGSSKYGFHWTGDNYANWQFLKTSISDNFNNQMYGFQMVGADICGFGGDTQQELCSRWYQLGSLYPFARSHNMLGSISQQPYALGPVVLEAATKSIKLRYSLLKYYYTLFIAKRGLGSIWKPLFFVYHQDSNAYIEDIMNSQFLIGNHLLVAPILQKGTSSRKVYFPLSNWYDLLSGKIYAAGTNLITGYTLTQHVPIFLREGSVIFTQNIDNVVNTKQLNNEFILTVGCQLDSRRSNSTRRTYIAAGNILSLKDFHDDSKVIQCQSEGCEYVFQVIVTLGDVETVEVDVGYLGGAKLKEQIFLTGFRIYHEGKTIIFNLNQRFQVTGAVKKVFDIPKTTKSLQIN